MTRTLRIASYNVENMFSRAKILDCDDKASGAALLMKVAKLQELLEASIYDHKAIVAAYNDEIYEYINLRQDHGRAVFINKCGMAELLKNDFARSANEWRGAIEFKRTSSPEGGQLTLARVIREVLKADILCLCEVEDRRVLDWFNRVLLKGMYPYNILIDGNDSRGIDVAVLSRYPFGAVRTNIFSRMADGQERIFDRDCLEVVVDLPINGECQPLAVLANHFKSKSGGEVESDLRRIAQSKEVARILTKRYRDAWVVVAGDLNESAERGGRDGENLQGYQSSLGPLLEDAAITGWMHNTLRQYQPDIEKRFSYIHNKQKEQIDYLLLSTPLNDKVTACGSYQEGRFPGGWPKTDAEAASDHSPIYVDLAIPGLEEP